MKFLKRSQVIISAIALMLITAGYFNYVDNIDIAQTLSDDTLYSNEFAAIGDARLVDSEVELEGLLVDDDMEKSDTNEALESSSQEQENIEPVNDETGNIQNQSSISTNVANTENIDNYFVSSRLERNTMYSEMIATYERMIENPNVSETQKGIAANEIYVINSTKNAIMICENLIKNKGFEEVIVFSNNNSINVVVKATELKTEQVAQIQNIISRELNVTAENIHISYK